MDIPHRQNCTPDPRLEQYDVDIPDRTDDVLDASRAFYRRTRTQPGGPATVTRCIDCGGQTITERGTPSSTRSAATKATAK